MADILQFPTKVSNIKGRISKMENRLTELENENSWIRQDITEMGDMLEKNILEMQGLLRDLASLQGFEEPLDLNYDDSDDLEPDF
jgi:uncharacterized coiled-coil protein SlyX